MRRLRGIIKFRGPTPTQGKECFFIGSKNPSLHLTIPYRGKLLLVLLTQEYLRQSVVVLDDSQDI